MRCFLALYLFLHCASTFAAEHPWPHWIWQQDRADSADTASFQKTFAITGPVASATLRCVGNATSVTVTLNNTSLADLAPYDPIAQLDLTSTLRTGKHTLKVKSTSVIEIPGFFVLLEITYQDGSRQKIVSDKSWRVGDQPVHSLGEVERRLIVPATRQLSVDATDNYDQWKQALNANRGADPARFKAAPGFEVQLVRSAQETEDSWVSMAFDSQGRVIIAKEKRGLLRMTMHDDGSSVVNTEVVDDSLKECRGLLFVDDALFANANNSKGLYRLKPDGNDQFKKPELVFASTGGVGHGRNDLALGPDRMIYSIHGDAVDLPNDCIDHTSPFREARNGKKTSEGHLLRIDPVDGRAELLATGLRNPFGIDFNRDGELFTYDADAEYDMGAPWYRPTRINHLVVGGDFGWRGVTKSWPPYYPDRIDNARPGLDIGKGSPTAVKFGTRSNFPQLYRDALFVLDWTYGRIIAVHMSPRGASYLMAAETFLQGRPLNVTDLDFGPDGSMYFVTGGRKTHSALYRVAFIGPRGETDERPTPYQTERNKLSKASRKLRRKIESGQVTDDLETHLASTDPWIQYAARTHIEKNLDRLLGMTQKLQVEQSLQASLIHARSITKQDDHLTTAELAASLGTVDLTSLTRDQKRTLGLSYALVKESVLGQPIVQSSIFNRTIGEMYPAKSFQLNRLLSELLVIGKSSSVVPKTMDLLRNTSDQRTRMQCLHVLRKVDHDWTPALRREYFVALNSTDDFVGGDGMPQFLNKIREEAIQTLTPKERSELGSLIEPPVHNAEIVTREQRDFVRVWTVSELANDIPNGDPKRGQRVFVDALCINCHRRSGQGNFVGPDLTFVGRRFSPRDLLTSIIEPSLVVSEKYQSLQVVTTDGKSHVGQVALGGDYRSTKLRLATDPSNPTKTIEINKQEIESQRRTNLSWMPKGLLDSFTRQEIADLLAYLQS